MNMILKIIDTRHMTLFFKKLYTMYSILLFVFSFFVQVKIGDGIKIISIYIIDNSSG